MGHSILRERTLSSISTIPPNLHLQLLICNLNSVKIKSSPSAGWLTGKEVKAGGQGPFSMVTVSQWQSGKLSLSYLWKKKLPLQKTAHTNWKKKPFEHVDYQKVIYWFVHIFLRKPLSLSLFQYTVICFPTQFLSHHSIFLKIIWEEMS